MATASKSQKRKLGVAVATDDGESDPIEQFFGEKVKKEARKSIRVLNSPAKKKRNRETFFRGDPFFMPDLRRLGGQSVRGCKWLELLRVDAPPLSSLQSRIAPPIARIIRGVKPVAEWTLWDLFDESNENGKLSSELRIYGSRADGSSLTGETKRRALNVRIVSSTMKSFDKKFGADSQSLSKKRYKVFLDDDNCQGSGCVVLFQGNWLLQFELRANSDDRALPCEREVNDLLDCGGFEFNSEIDVKFHVCSGKTGKERNTEKTLKRCNVKLFVLSMETGLFPADDFVLLKRTDADDVVVQTRKVRFTGDLKSILPAESIVQALATRAKIIRAEVSAAPGFADSHMLPSVSHSKVAFSDASKVAASEPPFVAYKAMTSSLMSPTASEESTITDETAAKGKVKALENEVKELKSQLNALRNAMCACCRLKSGFQPTATESLPFGNMDSTDY